MSSLSSWSYVEGPVTVWPPGGEDEWGQPIGAEPYLIPNIDYEQGGEVSRDDSGVEFVPRLTVYFEAAFGSNLIPKREWKIKIGDHTSLSSPPSDAEKIRMVTAWPMTKFGEGELPDWQVEC